MDLYITLLILVTFVVSLIPVILGIVKSNKNNRKMLKTVLSAIVSFNVIWYFAFFNEFVRLNLAFSLNSEIAVNVVYQNFMFFIRFIYLVMFLKLFSVLLDLKLTKGFLTALKVFGIVVVGIWIFGLLEFFVLGSHVITSNIMFDTDIMMFFVVVICSIYIIYQVKHIYIPENQKAIKLLASIFLIPMTMALLKWISGGILKENYIREQLSMLFIAFLMNGLMILWLIVYGNKLKNFTILRGKEKNSRTLHLIQKYGISKREMDVIELICEGYSNKEIAEKLFISVDTVKDHNSRIYHKTELKNRTQLAKLFLE